MANDTDDEELYPLVDSSDSDEDDLAAAYEVAELYGDRSESDDGIGAAVATVAKHRRKPNHIANMRYIKLRNAKKSIPKFVRKKIDKHNESAIRERDKIDIDADSPKKLKMAYKKWTAVALLQSCWAKVARPKQSCSNAAQRMRQRRGVKNIAAWMLQSSGSQYNING